MVHRSKHPSVFVRDACLYICDIMLDLLKNLAKLLHNVELVINEYGHLRDIVPLSIIRSSVFHN